MENKPYCHICRKSVDALCDLNRAEYAYKTVPIVICKNMDPMEVKPVPPSSDESAAEG